MTTPRPRVRVLTYYPPEPGTASLEELRRRATELRQAIAKETELSRVVDQFHDRFVPEELFHELSRPTDDARFQRLLGDRGILGVRYPGEPFRRQLLHCAELRLFHGCLLSERHIGCVFQFEGDPVGIIAVSAFGRGAPVAFLRYAIVPSNSFLAGGGSA